MREKSRINPLMLERAREMRKEAAPAKKILWACLRNRQLGGFKFRRQHSVGWCIIDFYCAERNLGVELDGDSHSERVQYDERRTEELTRQGISIVRYVNTDVFDALDAVLEELLERLEAADNMGADC